MPLSRLPRVVMGAFFSFCAIGSSCSQSAASDDAHFVVTDTIVNADVKPFTATIGAIGNGHRLSVDSGFEPLVFRTMIQTTAPSANRIIAPANVISHYDSWRTGALDGAEVEILRIVDGSFRSVRTDRVAVGGHQASGWLPVMQRETIVSQATPNFEFSWEPWNRPDAPYYFTVRAVDRSGHLSPAAGSIVVYAPKAFPRQRPQAQNALSAMKWSDTGGKLEAPTGLSAVLTDKGTVRFAWDAVRGAEGYVVFRSDVPPTEHRGYFFELEGNGPVIEAGDLVIIRNRFLRAERGKRLTNRVWNAYSEARPFRNRLVGWSDEPGNGNWTLVPHDAQTPVSEPGETFLRLSLAKQENIVLGNYNHSGLQQSYYDVLEPGRFYRFEVWMRGRSGRPVTFLLTGLYGSNEARVDPIRFSITSEWKKYSSIFEVPKVHPSAQVGQMQLRIEGPDTVDIDNFRIYRDDADFLSFLPEDIARLEASGMGALRTHGFIKTGFATYDLNEITNPGGVSNTAGGNTIEQTLAEIARLKMDPWLQIEPHLSRQEWLGLAEYLAATFDPAKDDPSSRPWAAKRFSQGHEPWVGRFDRILFEIGNETWNRLFAPWIFPPMTDAATGKRYSSGTVYGLYQEYVLSIFRESPHWPELAPKLTPVIGGWSGFDYGLDASLASPNTPIMTHAAYNGGWDENEGPVRPDDAGLSSVLTHVLQTGLIRAENHRKAAVRIGAERGAPLFTGTYEAGPGYAMNGLNGEKVTPEQAAQQEAAMKSVAAGTATLDAFLMRALQGQKLQNFFTYGSGERWTSHARWQKGGQTFPAWDLLAFFNNEALGDLLDVETLRVPKIDLPAAQRREAVSNGPLVAVYATSSDDRLVLFIISRRVPGYPYVDHDGSTTVTVDLPITRAESMTRISQSGNWKSHNVDTEATRLVSENLPVPKTLPVLTVPSLPPGETMIFVFDGTDQTK
jgi:hypothetical protein